MFQPSYAILREDSPTVFKRANFNIAKPPDFGAGPARFHHIGWFNRPVFSEDFFFFRRSSRQSGNRCWSRFLQARPRHPSQKVGGKIWNHHTSEMPDGFQKDSYLSWVCVQGFFQTSMIDCDRSFQEIMRSKKQKLNRFGERIAEIFELSNP